MSKPTCENCGKSGNGVVFNVMGPFEFGKYCVDCEKIIVENDGASALLPNHDASKERGEV